MGKITFSLPFLYKGNLGALIVALFPLYASAAQPPQRIHGDLSDYSRFAVAGNVRPSLAHAADQGEVDGDTLLPQMTIHFSMTPSQNADLLQLARLQQTKHSDQFHKWLTPEQFADRFGMNEKDIERVKAWLESLGFANVEAARSRNLISFSGTAAQAQNAFHTAIRRYTLNNSSHFANATAPELPRALNGIVAGIRGLNDFHPKPHARPRFTSSISGNHFLTPDDVATIYDLKALYGNGIDGTGWTIAIPGQTDIIISDIQAFRSAAALSATVPTVILTGRDPGTKTTSGDLSEADLDIEWAGGVAKGAQIIYVNSTNVFNSVSYAITNNVADVLSITYGDCESDLGQAEINSLNAMFLQANTQGMTVTAAAGDDGAADCDGGSSNATAASQGLAVDFPASSPYVTGVGGTSFAEGSGSYWSSTNNANSGSALAYIPETVWNEVLSTTSLEATGGGVSIFTTKPSWQIGTGVPNDGFRDVPDVAFAADPSHDGYLTCSNGNCVNGFRDANSNLDVIGGTSAGSPLLGAIIALLDQKTGARQGNININLYALASVSSDAFHDVTSGNNIVPCVGGSPNCSSTTANVNGTLGYSAGTGYDQVTGLGSVDGYHLATEWPTDLQISISPTSLQVARATTGTATINVTEISFSGPVSFTCTVNSPLTNTTCAVSGTATGSGSTATLTITAGASASAPWWHRTPQFPTFNGRLLWSLAALFLSLSIYLLARKKIRLFSAGFALSLTLCVCGCGSGSSSSTTVTAASSTTSTPVSETGTIKVVGTSGNFTSSSTISVTVQ